MGIMDFTKQAMKNLFSKPATSAYPFVPKEYPERSRGHIEIDIDKCIMCGICSKKCMSAAITVDRATKTWSIERMGCIQCGSCVLGCPKQCLSIVPGYTEPNTEKVVDSYSQPVDEKAASADSGASTGKIKNDIDKCILCGLCSRKCPQECITVDRKDAKTWSINRDDCVQCGACIDACAKFKALSFTEDDGETGVVTLKKEDNAPAKPATPAPAKEETAPATEEKAEDVLTSGKIFNEIDKCLLCGLCARQCPQECIEVDRKENKTWTINRDDCVQCGACIDACAKFKALKYVEDDGETGSVTFKKE